MKPWDYISVVWTPQPDAISSRITCVTLAEGDPSLWETDNDGDSYITYSRFDLIQIR